MVGSRLGNLNQIIYPLAASTQYPTTGFHDITTGNNGLFGVTGFFAGPGYDECTGWGSVDFNVFAPAVVAFIPTLPSPTAIPSHTATPTVTPTATPTFLFPTPTATNTATATATATPTVTGTPTPTPTPASSIFFVGASPLADYSNTVTTVTISLPDNVQSGDVLLAQIIVYDGSASDVPRLPNGWNSIRHDAVNSGNEATSWLYYKVADSGEPASYGWSINSNFAAGVMGAWRGASSSPIDTSSGATSAGTSPLSVAASSLTPANNNELQVYFYGSRSHAGPIITLSNALNLRFGTSSSKEGFTLAFADLAAPFANNPSSVYFASARISGGAVMTGQALLLIPTSQSATPTPTGTMLATKTATATMTMTATASPTVMPTSPGPTPTALATPTLTTTPIASSMPTPTTSPASSISFVGAGPLADHSSTVTTVTVGLPSGIQSGDTLLAQIIVYDGNASDVPTAPSGWDSIREDSANSGNQATSWLYYKVAGANEPPFYKWNIGANWAAGVMGAWRGASPSPINAASGATAGGATPIFVSAPSLTAAASNELQVYFYASQSHAGPIISLPNAITQRFNTASSKEGFTLAFADLAAPPVDVPSSTFPAVASIPGSAVLTAQAVLLIPASQTGDNSQTK